MEPWGIPALTGYSCEYFSSRTTGRHLLLRNDKITPNIWPEILKLVKKTSIPNSVESLGYIKWYSSISPRPIKSPSSSISYCKKINSRSRRSKTISEIRKQTTFLNVINKHIIHKFFKDFTNHRKRTNRVVVLCQTSFPNIPNCRDHQWDLSTIWKTRFLQTHIEEFN